MSGVAPSHYASASQRRLDLIGRSLRGLAAGALHEAYLLADISCQSRVPAAEDLLLRGEIAARLGFATLERADIEAAFAIDPSSPSVQLRMLEALRRSGEADAADVLARAILRLDPQRPVLGAAIAALKPAAGTEGIGWAQAGPTGLRLVIFSAAERSFEIRLSFEHRCERLIVHARADEGLASAPGAACHCEIAWPEGARSARFASEPALDWVGPPAFRPFHPAASNHRQPPHSAEGPAGPVTVIMPVYADLGLTQACIDSVLSSRSTLPERLVLVDDCGPDRALRALLADYACRPDVALIVNPTNLGFIGSVNHALSRYPDGDVVLLNADTIVAPGWLARLSRAAHSRRGVGTATPLSNNGELTSVPAPFEVTAMPAAADVAAIDNAASELHQGQTIELPNGVGFCLYVTEACRHATGFLNDADYREGYLEEVDYCLRAAERGFSHVCACDVFVGHAGSKSFQARKRGLVTHNLSSLERGFPGVRGMTQRFIDADPLQPLRFALQRRLLRDAATERVPVTLVIGRQAIAASGSADLPAIAKLAGERSLLRLSFAGASDGSAGMLHRDGAMAPHRLPLQLDPTDPLADLLGLIGGHKIERIVYLDGQQPLWARELPRLLAVEYAIHAVDDSVLGKTGTVEKVASGAHAGFLDKALRFTSASPRLSDLAGRRRLRRPDHEPLRLAPPAGSASAKAHHGPTGIAIFMSRDDGAAWRWVRDLGRAILRQRRDLRLVVLGTTLDDDGLRRTGAVTVTAMPSAALAPAIFALHRCAATIALIPDGVIETADLPIIAQGPRPLLSWNRHLPDVLACAAGESRHFAAGQSAGTVLGTLAEMLGGGHG